MIGLWRRLRGRRDPLACREFVELVTDYLDHELSESDRARFEAHLADCDGCHGYLQDMQRMITSLGRVPAPPPDPETREVLLRAFRELRGPGSAP